MYTVRSCEKERDQVCERERERKREREREKEREREREREKKRERERGREGEGALKEISRACIGRACIEFTCDSSSHLSRIHGFTCPIPAHNPVWPGEGAAKRRFDPLTRPHRV